MFRVRALATIGILLVVAGCAAPPKVVSNVSPAVSPSPSASASPSPSSAPLAITSAAFHTGEIGFAYAPVTPGATGGVPPYTWSISGGSLPTGLTMSPAGKVAGTPAAAGTFLFTIHLDDSNGASATFNSSIGVVKRLVVTAQCPTSSPCLVEAGCVTACGVFGNQSGGAAPFSYRLIGGAIPTGMGLSGLSLTKAFPTPGTADWVFTLRITDGVGATAQTTAKFHVFPHIAWVDATGTCTGTVPGGCTTTLKYSGGSPGGASVTVKQDPKYPPIPAKSTFDARSGVVTVTIPGPGCSSPYANGFTAVVALTLTDGSVCGPGYKCSTAGSATLTIRLATC